MAIIPHTREEGKIGPRKLPEGALTALIVLLASSASFGLGMLAERSMSPKDEGVKIEGVSAEALSAAAALAPIPKTAKSAPAARTAAPKAAKALPTGTATAATGKYVASRNGAKYYLPSCGTANRINEENKIYFNTKEEAEAAGFTPSATCKGL